MGEYANEPATGGPAVQQGGASPGGGSATSPGTGTGTPPAATNAEGGGGSQADQTGPEGFTMPDLGALGEPYEMPEWGEYGPTGEVINPDGSRTTLRHDGVWEYTDASGQKGVWDDGAWYDEASGEAMPGGFGDPTMPSGDYTASDAQDYASRLQDAARRAEASGNSDQAARYRQKYQDMVQKSNELGGQNPRGG